MNSINLPDLKGLASRELADFMTAMGQKPYRARQLASWIFGKGACQFAQMTDFSAELREKLGQAARITCLQLIDSQTSADGTTKYLFGLADGASVESVYIPDENRRTLCVSTQVGCKLGCAFCLTGAAGFTRDLQPAEIVDQVLRARALAPDGRVTNIVLMGMGEPLDNFDNTLAAIKILTDPEYGIIGARKITLSTAGLAPGIARLAREFSKVKLAVSLNSATDSVRERIMPVNKKYPLAELARALEEFPLPRGRRITLEYVLLEGVNDSQADAERLGRFAKRFPSKINLIPFNPAPGINFGRPSDQKVEMFKKWLFEMDIPAFIRKSKGQDILAACGQLRGARP